MFIVPTLTAAVSVSAPARTRSLPPPRLQIALGALFHKGNALRDVRLTPLGSVLLIEQGNLITAREQATGRELWQRTILETPNPFSKTIAGTQPGSLESWSVTASGMADGIGPVVFLNASRRIVSEDKSAPNTLLFRYFWREQMIQAATGRVLWETEWQEAPPMGDNRPFVVMGIYDSLIVEMPRSLDRWSKPLRLRYAVSGAVLGPSKIADAQAMRRAAARNRSPLLIASGSSIVSMNLQAGTAATLVPPGDYSAGPTAFFPTQQRIVLHLNADDDFVGHSLWPLYVVAYNEGGRQIWGLPRKVVRPLSSEEYARTKDQSVGRMVPCHAAGTVLCQDDRWNGLDARDGRILWQNKVPARWNADIVEAGRGWLVLKRPGAPNTPASLAWVNGRTGTFRWLCSVPSSVVRLFLVGDALYMLEDSACLRAYSYRDLISTPAFPRRTGQKSQHRGKI